jgi:hypothetical protein
MQRSVQVAQVKRCRVEHEAAHIHVRHRPRLRITNMMSGWIADARPLHKLSVVTDQRSPLFKACSADKDSRWCSGWLVVHLDSLSQTDRQHRRRLDDAGGLAAQRREQALHGCTVDSADQLTGMRSK